MKLGYGGNNFLTWRNWLIFPVPLRALSIRLTSTGSVPGSSLERHHAGTKLQRRALTDTSKFF